MPIVICQRCNQRVLYEGDSIDISHACNSGVPAVDNEDILVVGNWEDFSGSGTETNVLLQGTTNKFWGTRAAIEGEDMEDLTVKGNSTELFRTRQHIQFIKLKGGVTK